MKIDISKSLNSIDYKGLKTYQVTYFPIIYNNFFIIYKKNLYNACFVSEIFLFIHCQFREYYMLKGIIFYDTYREIHIEKEMRDNIEYIKRNENCESYIFSRSNKDILTYSFNLFGINRY